MSRSSLLQRILILLLTAAIVLLASGCDILQQTFPQPTQRSFPSLTPRPSQTLTVTPTPAPTLSPSPTQAAPAKASTPLALAVQPITAGSAENLELAALFGLGIPQQMVVSPDGSLLAASTTHGVYLFDANSLQLLESWITNDIQHSLVFSPDGLHLASGSSRGGVSIWNIEDGDMSSLPGGQPVLALAYDEGGERLASSSWDGMLRVWQAETGKLLRAFPVRMRVVRSLAFSPDGELLFGWATNESVQVWRLSDGRSLENIYIGRDELGKNPYGGAFSRDGALFAANHGLRIRVFRTRNGTTRWLMRDIEALLENMALSPGGRLLAAEEQNTIKIWDMESGAQFAKITLPPSEADRHLLAFSPDEKTLFTLGSALIRWEVPIPDEEITLIDSPRAAGRQEFTSSVLIGFQAFENSLYLAALKGRLSTFDVRTGDIAALLPPNGDVVLSFAVSPGSGRFALGHPDGSVRLLDEDNQLLLELDAHNGPVRSLAFSPDGDFLASGGEDSLLQVWQVNDGSLMERIQLTNNPQEIFFLPGDELLVRMRDGADFLTLKDAAVQHTFPGYRFAVSGDGQLLAAASQSLDGNVVNLYRLPMGTYITSVPLAGNRLALSPDHSVLATAGEDLMLWRTEDGRLLQSFSEVNLFGEIQFSSDGMWLILGTWDGTLRLWGVPRR